MRITHFLLFCTLLSSAVASGGVWYDGDKIAPDRSHQKAKDGLGVQLQLTNDASFFDDWALPHPPNLKITHIAQVGDTIYSVLLFFGAGKDKKGESNVTFEGRVLGPDGNSLQEFKDVRVVHGPNLAGEYDLGLSEGHMIAQFSKASLKGTYTFEVTVTDHIKKVSILLLQKLERK
jgi:hypothetical protein